MPALTVSMPAYNSEKYIRESIESVLRQEGVDFELIVVDDGSKDRTAEIVQSFSSPRIRLIRNEKNMGIGYCHNLVIRHSTSPYIAHVDSDDIVMPGAFLKMVQKLESDLSLGQAHCHFFDIDEDGRATRESFQARRTSFQKYRQPNRNYKRDLLIYGSIMNHLRTYRREVFDRVGYFNETLKYGEDHEMAVRVIDKYKIEPVPEFLYCRRIHKNNTTPARFLPLRTWLQRVRLSHRLLKRNEVTFLKQQEYGVKKLMLIALGKLLRIQHLRPILMRMLRAARHFVRYRILPRVFGPAYDWSVNHLSWWPMDLFTSQRKDQPNHKKRIAFCLAGFPVLSETFIQREIRSLREAGMDVQVFAERPVNSELFDEQSKALSKATHYLLPMDPNLLAQYKKFFFSKNPLLYLNLFVYVVLHNYGPSKYFQHDVRLFNRAVYLAGRLREHQMDHVHSPWADRSSFISLIASKHLGVTYTLQTRAHDVQDKAATFSLVKKCGHAQAIFTNTRFNQSYLQSILRRQDQQKIVLIYEGLEMTQFNGAPRTEKKSDEMKILCVARLIEEKGLIYLLRACKIIQEKGHAFQCEIIGNRQTQANYYVKLKKLHRELALEANVFFPGGRSFDKVLEAYHQADIFVLPCVIAERGTHDVTPNVLIEAMAMKLPVVTTPIGGISEIIDHGVNGLLVRPRDPELLSDALIQLVQNTDLRKRLGQNARQTVEERFDINKNIVRFVEILEENTKEHITSNI